MDKLVPRTEPESKTREEKVSLAQVQISTYQGPLVLLVQTAHRDPFLASRLNFPKHHKFPLCFSKLFIKPRCWQYPPLLLAQCYKHTWDSQLAALKLQHGGISTKSLFQIYFKTLKWKVLQKH